MKFAEVLVEEIQSDNPESLLNILMKFKSNLIDKRKNALRICNFWQRKGTIIVARHRELNYLKLEAQVPPYLISSFV